MEERGNLAMEEGAASRNGACKMPAGESLCCSRSVVPQGWVGNYRDQESHTGTTPPSRQTEATQSSTHYGETELGASTSESNGVMESSHSTDTNASASLVQEAQHDDAQLEEEGIRTVTVPALLDLLKKQDFRCALSGRKLTPQNVILDHIDSFASSNDHSIRNIQLVVNEANRAKGSMKNGDFIQLCRDVAARHPPGTGLLASSAI